MTHFFIVWIISGLTRLNEQADFFLFASFKMFLLSNLCVSSHSYFPLQGNAVLSASSDGSVRAFDLTRYRNFRIFTSTLPEVQFNAVAVDGGGEIVVGGCQGAEYSVLVWSIQVCWCLANAGTIRSMLERCVRCYCVGLLLGVPIDVANNQMSLSCSAHSMLICIYNVYERSRGFFR